MPQSTEVLQGTLDLMVLKTLDAMGPLHGFGIARRIEQISDGVLQLNEGTVYASLLRLQQRAWISAAWGVSENNRKAKFYAITRSGRKQLGKEAENWERISGVVGRVLSLDWLPASWTFLRRSGPPWRSTLCRSQSSIGTQVLSPPGPDWPSNRHRPWDGLSPAHEYSRRRWRRAARWNERAGPARTLCCVRPATERERLDGGPR